MAKVNLNSPLTMEGAFEGFLFSKSAQGVTDKTLKSYRSHFKCISNYPAMGKSVESPLSILCTFFIIREI